MCSGNCVPSSSQSPFFDGTQSLHDHGVALVAVLKSPTDNGGGFAVVFVMSDPSAYSNTLSRAAGEVTNRLHNILTGATSGAVAEGLRV